MDQLLKETRWLYEHLLDSEQQHAIHTFMENKETGHDTEALSIFWGSDAEIGGIGGYSLPKNPVKNPFPGGVKRKIYRPLQYAASEIERDVAFGSRYIVQYAGMHLEAVAREYLMQTQTLGKLRNYNSTLGKVVHQISSLQTLNETSIQSLFQFVSLYNMSKHEVNQDDSRERLFTSEDALIAYLTARILGVYLLTSIDIKIK